MARIDIITPFFDEADSAEAFAAMMGALEADIAKRFGLTTHKILIDDGSSDHGAAAFARVLTGSWEIARLSRNFGKEVAVLAGLDRVGGDFVLLMDADMQHTRDVALTLIGTLLADPALDVVYARIEEREGSWQRSQMAKAFYRLINSAQRFDIPENAGDFRVMRRPVADALAKLRDKRRFNKGLYAWAGFRQKAIAYQPAARGAGTSKWSRLNLLAFSLEGLTSFSIVPLRIVALSGLAVALFGFLYGIKIVFEVLVYGVAVPGYPSLLVAVVLLGGFNLALLGLIGEYVWVTVSESKERPSYLLREVIAPPLPADASQAAGEAAEWT